MLLRRLIHLIASGGVAWNSGLAPVLVLGAALLPGCSRKNEFIEPPPPEVTVALPVERDMTEYLEATATAHPILVVEIRARVRGFLKECLVNEGADVKEGQLLLVIDEEPFRVRLDQAKAKLAEAQTALKKSTQSQAREIARAQLELDESQLEVATTEEERMKQLVVRAVSQEELDRAVANRKKNAAQVASTKANLTQIGADYDTNISAAEASVSAAKTAVREAEIDLGYCRITSPLTGRIGRIDQDVGNLVGDGQASLLATVVKYDPIHVYTTINVDDFLKYRSVATGSGALAGTGAATPTNATPAKNDAERQVSVELALSNESGYLHHGQIDYHDPVVDKGTGTIELRGVFPNPLGAILPGMFARIRIPIATRAKALLVPEPALGIDQSGQFLLVVGSDDKVDYRPVTVGQVDRGMRVVEGKIGPQDRVIVEGLLRARPGMKVVPQLEATSSEQSSVARSPNAQSPNAQTARSMSNASAPK